MEQNTNNSNVNTPKKKTSKSGCLIFGVIVIVLIIVVSKLASSGSKKPEQEASSLNVSTTISQNYTAKPSDTEAPTMQWIKPGMYKVGSDLQAGEYVVFSDSSILPAYFQVTKDSTGALNSIISNDSFSGTRYVTVRDGQYIEIRESKMLPLAQAPIIQPTDGKYTDGMYKVGRDIQSGEYKAIPEDGAAASYVEVAKDSAGGLNSIITNDILSGEKYITIQPGQYLKLVGCYIAAE